MVVGGTASEPGRAGGTPRPVFRTASSGRGGGGIRSLSVRIRGIEDGSGVREDFILCALFRAGKAGASSVWSLSVSVADPSSSESVVTIVGGSGCEMWAEIPPTSQFRR